MSKCYCIRSGKFDFVLKAIDCSTLSYEDMSDWQEGEKYEKPTTYNIFLGIGSGGKKISVKTEGLTIINAEDVGMNSFADAVYCVKTETMCTEAYIRYRVVSCRVECCIQDYVYSLVKRKAPNHDYSDIWRIQGILDMARMSADRKNAEEAKGLLEAVKEEIEELNCNCKCK